MDDLTRPLSVVVLGNSVSIGSVPARRGREDGTYAEVLRDRLTAAGVAVHLHLEGRWFDFAPKALRRYERSVRAHTPDVLVLQYGLNESQPYLVPVWLLRHFLDRHGGLTPAARRYRKVLDKRIWPAVRRYRQVVSARVGTHTWQTSPARFAGAMTALISAARADFRPLVLVLDINPPGRTLTYFLPGMPRRHEIVQRTLAEVVAGFEDDEVRLVAASAVVDQLGPRAGSPDGMHFSPKGHAVLGDMLAQEVLGWLGRRGASS